MSRNNNQTFKQKRDARQARPLSKAWQKWLGVLPFFAFALLFIFLPSVNILAGSFKDNEGKFTFQNMVGLLEPSIVNAYWVTIKISLTTAIGGGLLGFLMAYSVTVGKLPRIVRILLSTFSGVASNFAGVPLAFAFIATLGRTGLITVLLKSLMCFYMYADGFKI
jgi:putative spermidine/putrescine transport system permease protein